MDEIRDGQLEPESATGVDSEEAAAAWRRGRASVAPGNGAAAQPHDKTRETRERVVRQNGGAPPQRRLPEAGGWSAPIELQPGVHYKAFTLPPGYVPGYPVPPGQGGEEEQGPGLIEYWRVLRRRQGTVLLVGAIGLILAVLITLPMTPVYSASLTLEIQEMNRNFMNMSNVNPVSSDFDGYMLMTDIQTQLSIIQSQTLLDRVVNKFEATNTAAPDTTPPAGRMSAWRKALHLPEPTAANSRATALAMAAGSVRARAQGQTRLIGVSVDSTDKKLATDFANMLATEFIEQNMEARWQQTQKTGEWLTRQLDEMKIKLEKSEDQLQEYARRSGLLFTQEKSSVSEERLKQMQEALSTATAERITKQSRFEMAKSASPETLPDVISDDGLRELQSKVTELHRQAAELRSTYNEKYPKLARIEPQIRLLENQFQQGTDRYSVSDQE